MLDVIIVMVAVVLGAVVGGQVAGRFMMPIPIDRSVWHVVSPGLDERVQDPENGRGVYVEDGALTLRQHAFHRAEILSPKDTTAVRQVSLDIASGTLRLNFPGPSGVVYATLSPDTVPSPTNARELFYRPQEGPWLAEVEGDQVVLRTTNGPITLGSASGGSIELTAISEEVRLRSITVTDHDGRALVAENYAARATPRVHWMWGAVVGLVFGLFGRVATRRHSPPRQAVELGALVFLPLVVCAVPSADWLYLVERAYLVRTPAWGLARILLGLALLPTLALALLRSGVLEPPDLKVAVPGQWLWLGTACVAAGLGWLHGDLTLANVVVGLVGLGFLLLPLRIAEQANLSLAGALLVDAPAMLAVAVLGWGPGLLVALGWRGLTVVSAAGKGLLRTAPRPATDLLFAMLLLFPVALEWSVRNTYLAEGWDLTRLSGDLAPSVGWQDPAPFWRDACGDQSESARTVRILWMGGSSTGGAYQFRDQPTAFYPAQTHHRLCQQLGDGVRLVSENYGDGGRDTFTISRSLAAIADRSPPSLVVVYTGVNDLLTMSGSQTRAQREAAQAERDAASTGLASIGARSRLLTGIGLFLRPLHDTESARVPEVPLTDARENFQSIASVAESHGARVLLLTEVIRTDASDPLAPYAALEAQVAEQLAAVHFFDLRAALAAQGPWDDQAMLVDQNHLSREGSGRVAAALTPPIASILGLAEPVDPAPADVEAVPPPPDSAP